MLATASEELGHYKVIIFIVLVVGVYGFVLLRISELRNAQPTQDMISAQSSPVNGAHIDKNVVHQLQQLQDNSVSVQSLFNDARSNPFQE